MRPGQASVTARRVAALRLTFERAASPYGDATVDERLSRDVAGSTAPGATSERMVRYLAARTRFFDQVVVGALGRGVDQVVVAAAGYDGRAWRYAKPGVSWFELDHPATQADKLARLDALGVDRSGVGFASADFAHDDVAAALRGAGIDPDRPSLVLCEGVVAYLDRDTTDRLFAGLRAAVGSRSVLAVSLSTASGTVDGAQARARFRAAVAAVGEAATDPLTVDDAGPILRAAGWEPRSPDSDGGGTGRRAGLLLADATGFHAAPS